MGKFLHRGCLRTPRCSSAVVLAAVWIIGLGAGVLSAANASESYFLMMRRAALCPVSIVGCFAVACLPFLFAAFAVYISRPRLLYILCFGKAFLLASCFAAIAVSFGTAGWLARLLLQFSNVLLAPVLCWFCIRHIGGQADTLGKDLLICGAAALACGGLDYLLIAPFLARILEF